MALKAGIVAGPVSLAPETRRAVMSYFTRVMPSSFDVDIISPSAPDMMFQAFSKGFDVTLGLIAPRSFALKLNESDALLLVQRRFEKRGEFEIWTGGATLVRKEMKGNIAPRGPAYLVTRGSQIQFGLIYTTDGAYNLIGFQGGLVGARKVDPKKFLQDHPGLSRNNSSTDGSLGLVPQAGPFGRHVEMDQRKAPTLRVALSGTSAVPKVLIAIFYTKAAREFMLDSGKGQTLEALIRANLAALRDSLEPAGADADFVLIEEVPYTEKGHIGDNVDCIKTGAEGTCKDLVNRRLKVKADLFALVVGPKQGCGLSAHTGVHWKDPDLGFSVVGVNCMSNGQIGLLHELGHLFGAQHDDNATARSFPFARGYVAQGGLYASLMAVVPTGGRARVPVWFNPRLAPRFTDGKPFGDANHDNAQVISRTAPTIADFH